MSKLIEYIIAGVFLIVALSVALWFLKVTVKILVYLFLIALFASAIAYLYNRFFKK